jgi:hypothetical protein
MLLAIYLNDHLAGATVGRELAKRAAASNRGTPIGAFLLRLTDEIEKDRATLLAIMHELGIRVDRLKVLGGWGAEKLGRLKLNGRMFGYSPLSRVVELEGLTLGVEGKLLLWRTLSVLEPAPAALARFDLPDLIRRAERQLAELEDHRRQSVATAFSGV